MSINNTLLLIKDFSNLNTDTNYLSVVPLTSDAITKLKIKEINFLLPEKNEIVRNYNFCDQTYKNILKKITKIFNKINKKNYKVKDYEIIIGYWLKNYIYLTFKILDQLKFILKSEKISHILLSEHKNFDFVKENTADFASAHALDIQWYYCYFSKIFDYFMSDTLKDKVTKKILINKKLKKIPKKGTQYLNKILNIFSKYRNQNNAFIAHSYLPFFEEKKLELIFNQIPHYYKILKTKKGTPTEIEQRKNYSNLISYSESKFENFLLNNLFTFLQIFS